MSRNALALILVLSLPAAALDACSALNPVEIAATLRGPGVVLAFHSKTDQFHLSTCFLARIEQPGSFDQNLSRVQVEAPLTLAVSLTDTLGSGGFDLLKAPPQTTETAVPGVGDRAVLRHAAKAEALLVASGSNFLVLSLTNETPDAKQDPDLISLAQEAVATNFDGQKVAKYEVADRALANDKKAFEGDPENFAWLLMAMKRFDEASIYSLRAIAANPNDTDVLYQRGVLDWMVNDYRRKEIQSRMALDPFQPLEGTACAAVRSANRERVEEGISVLSKAIKLQPTFDDAMHYLFLMYRMRADYECDDADARATDLKSAEKWADEFMVTKGANAGKSSSQDVLPLFHPSPPAISVLEPPPLLGVLPSPPMPGVIGGVLGGMITSTPVAVPKVGASTRVRVSAGVMEGLLIKTVAPVYPDLARQASIQGAVLLQGIISREGSIMGLKVIDGHPMLVPAAINAVKQWQYKPYILNGEPVEVETQITVNFMLGTPPVSP